MQKLSYGDQSHAWAKPLNEVVTTLLIGPVLLLGSGYFATPALADAEEISVTLEPMEMAITVDDLPVHGELQPGMTPSTITSELITALKDGGSPPVYGFSNGTPLEWTPTSIEVLRLWRDAGFLLGNHTYSHLDLAQVSVERFLADVEKMAALLAPWIAGQEGKRLFRYPYLSEGNTLDKRQGVRSYLAAHGYDIAPVTVDFNDWQWAAAYLQCTKEGNQTATTWLLKQAIKASRYRLAHAQQLAKLMLGRDIKHILLLHISAFSARALPDILATFKAEGVKFVSLAAALSDPIYAIDPNQLMGRDTTFLMQLTDLYNLNTTSLQPLYDGARLDNTLFTCARYR